GCPPATRRFTGCRCAATGVSTTPSTWPRSPRSGTSTATAGLTTTGRSPRGKPHKEALRGLKRRISDAIYPQLPADARNTAAASLKDRGGQPGNHSVSGAAGSPPAHQLFGPATPGPQTSLRPAAALTPAISPSEPPAKKARRPT